MSHKLSSYRDGFKPIEYCIKCGAEGLELFRQCQPIEPCTVCGHIVCKCDEIRIGIKSAIDKTNARN